MNGPRVIVPDKIFPAQPIIYLLGQSQPEWISPLMLPSRLGSDISEGL
jgi:hypothetical protein